MSTGLPTKTKQWVLTKVGSYENLTLEETTIPKLHACDVLVKVHAVSLQYRDYAMASGIYPVGHDGVVVGSDMAGEVIALGEDVKHWKVGDRVCSNFSTDHIYGDTNAEIIATSLGAQCDGVLTQYRSFPAHALVSIPANFDYLEASTLPCAALTAYSALHGPVPIKAGETVLVLGTGGVSMFAAQIAFSSGAVVIGTTSSKEKADIAQEKGHVHHIINYKTHPEWDQEVMKLTNGRGVDHVIEVGGQGTLARSIGAARIGGSIHLIGFISKDDRNVSIVYNSIMKTLHIQGVYTGSVAQFRDMNRLIDAHPKYMKPIIDSTFKFEEALSAYARLKSQQHVGKVCIQVA
ncbi:NAD-P-binding protein [Panaeolus papilionaceus]|nr:NAD-P-binding protein [Panaeolus papilionaceus]